MVFSIVPIGILVLLIIIIIITVGVKSEATKKGGENVIKSVYTYLVLFATLMMTIGGCVGSFMALADIIAPAPYYQTYEDFQSREYEMKTRDDETVELTENEKRERYENMIKSHRQNQIDRAKNSLVNSFGWRVIPLPVFIVVSRRLKEKEE